MISLGLILPDVFGAIVLAPPPFGKEVKHMAKNSVRTSAPTASEAGKALKDGRSSSRTKSIAGSALSNRRSSSVKK
jgi:hypothetical protein